MTSTLFAAEPPPRWKVARSPHFEAYSQDDDATISDTLQWFERLRQFFLQRTGLNDERIPLVRVIGFRSAEEYKLVQSRPTSDAYYLGTNGRDYIVMPRLGASEFRVAAHEYTHAVMRAVGVRLPPWLNEGLAELFSTIRIDDGTSTFGGGFQAHTQLLKRRAWLPLSELLMLPADSSLRDDRENTALFYAESWALTYMLVVSPDYGPRFQQLVAAVNAEAPGDAFERVYSKSLTDVEKDLRAWLMKGGTVTKPVPAAVNVPVRVSEISATVSQAMLADLLLASGQLDRAETLYRDLVQEAPGSGDFAAALAIIAVKRGDIKRGRELWRKAMASEVSDPMLCYQYAVLDGNAGLPSAETRAALQRAVLLKPDFDDARYLLALNEQNSGDFEETVTELRALKTVPPKRAFQYWSTLAYALDAVGKHEEAKQAAIRAKEFAGSESQRAQAMRLAYMADTELAVQFTEDANGHKQAVTTRVPRGTVNHNPFIEPGDQIRQARGQLKEIECQGQITGIVVDAPEGTIQLTIPSPQQVQILNGPSEFQCGAQSPLPVVVSYALTAARDRGSSGVVRGIEFQ